MTVKVVFITTPLGASNWTVPADCTMADSVECIGGGGGGHNSAGYGGGGGGYSKIINLALTPGASVAMGIGAGGTSSVVAGDTWFNGASMATPPTVGAKGGGIASSSNGAPGLASGGIGTTKYSGGNGGAAGSYTGGGGGAGSQYGDGKAGGTGGAGTNGGGGGSAGGGSVGADGGATYGGAGGNNNNSTDGGGNNPPTAGAGRNGFVGAGGGGAYSASQQGGAGAPGREYQQTSDSAYGGAGGGGGGEYTDGTAGGTGGLYGGGGGSRRGAVGAQGIIIVTYTAADPATLSGEAVLAGITADGSMAPQPDSSIAGEAILAGITADGGMGLAPGVITTPVLKNNTGTILASVSGIVANVYHPTTGVLVVRKTGLTSDGSGIVTISDVLIVGGTTYAYELDLSASTQGRRLPTGVAA